MIVGVAGSFEYYSLGVNERLGKEKIEILRIQLENGKQSTEQIAAEVLEKTDKSQSQETLIDGFIERSRKSTYERFTSKT